MLLRDLLRRPLAENPDKVALRFGDDSWTYRQLDDIADTLAASLLAHGYRRGDHLGLLLPNCPEMIFTYLACFKAGIAAVPINYRFAVPEIDYVLQHCGVSSLVAHADREDDLRKSSVAPTQVKEIFVVGGDMPGLGQPFARLLRRPATAPASGPLDDADIVLILYTSGTTAHPKGVLHTHASLGAAIALQDAAMQFGPSDVSLVSLSIAHAAGLVCQVLVTLAVGGTIALLPHFEPGEFLAGIAKYRPTYIEQLPAPLFEIVHHAAAKDTDFHSIRLCIAGGDKVPLPVHALFRELSGIEVTEVMGMTEALTWCMNPPYGAKKLGSIGVPVAGYEARLVDGAGHDVADGETGEMLVRSAAVTAGYWNDPVETEKALRGGWLHTGDMGRRDADGYFWFMGRKKLLIIRGGSNIAPQEVEDVLYQHPAVRQCCVVGVPDEEYGQRVLAFVTLKVEMPAPTELELMAFARERIAVYKAPEYIVFLESLPQNATGKVDRARLQRSATAPRS